MPIPKKIHYCWFGHGEKSEVIKKCMASWRKYCPDWEIIEWNEDNFDVNFCEYTKKAYDKKRYAYLTDAARLKIIYENGGIYLDTDVELFTSLEFLLKNKAWFCYMRSENPDGLTYTEINTGSGFGAEEGTPFVKKLLDQYVSFSYDQPFQICNRLDTEVFKREWKDFIHNEFVRQEFDNMVIIDDIQKYTLHHCENSWLPWYKKMVSEVSWLNKIYKIYKKKIKKK